jgi:hypothetical protein
MSYIYFLDDLLITGYVMKSVFKILRITALCFFVPALLVSCGKKIRFGEWTVTNIKDSSPDIQWIPFIWTADSFGKKRYERAAMFIPVNIEGLPGQYQFQFDLGANLTSLQGNTIISLFNRYPQQNRIRNYSDVMAFEYLALSMGSIKATTKNCYVMAGYGPITPSGTQPGATPVKIGTIGADMFQNRFLIIDYPNERFAVSDTLPDLFNVNFAGIDLDETGRIILPMQLGHQTYRVMFDTGSSLFSLIIPAETIEKFSASPGTDTVAVSSWGKTHHVIGRALNKSFSVAGLTFSNVTIYADYRQEAVSRDYDAIAGNALFWDKTVIIDFKNKRFGVK